MNLSAPDVSTLLDAVMMAARAAILPAGVSTVTSRPLQAMRLAGVDSASGTCSPSFAINVPRPWRQAIGGIALLRADLVDRGKLLQILPRRIGAEQEFHRRGPVAEILRQDGSAGHIGPAARGIVDGAVGAHQGGQQFLDLAGAGVAAADTDFLPKRRRTDLQPRGAREFYYRVGVGIMDPARAAVERHVEGRGVGDATPADLAGGFQHNHLAVRSQDAPRRRDAGRPRADHDNVSLARQRRGRCPPAEGRCDY